MTRRGFLAATAALLPARAESLHSGILLSEGDVGRMRDFVRRDRAAVIEKHASAALQAGPWSVTWHRPSGLGVDAGPHDYVSEGPYWWPDPKNPAGPYIRRDGERNPDRFMGNRGDLGDMCAAVLALGMGAFLLNKSGCAEHANKVLSAWFVDPKTRMNPNLQYGQMVRGHNTGRGTGIIDTVSLIHTAQGVVLLEMAVGLDADVAKGVRDWYADYLKWMTTSKYGLDEKSSGNNHATWWTAQAAAYAALAGVAGARRMCWDHYRNYLVPTEIQPDGSCPREESRTNSLGYSSMNLDAFSVICRLAQVDGVDLWHYRTPKGIGVDRAFSYLIPYVLHPDTWKKQQISKYNAGGYVFPGLAGIGIPSEELLSAYKKLPRADSPWVQFVDILVRA
ncbi:MAG TPA: alginate lyase family protein [Bryobacteraceae bacterium]